MCLVVLLFLGLRDSDYSTIFTFLMKLDIVGIEAETNRSATRFISKYAKITLINEDKHIGKIPSKILWQKF